MIASDSFDLYIDAIALFTSSALFSKNFLEWVRAVQVLGFSLFMDHHTHSYLCFELCSSFGLILYSG